MNAIIIGLTEILVNDCQVDDNGTLYAHVATGLFKGFIYQYTGSGTSWEIRDSNSQTASFAAGNTRDAAR